MPLPERLSNQESRGRILESSERLVSEAFTPDQQRLIRTLIRLRFIRFGKERVAGIDTPYVLDLQGAQNDGIVISDFEREYSDLISRFPNRPDAIAVVPSANVPLVARISQRLEIPMINAVPGADGVPAEDVPTGEDQRPDAIVVDDAATTGASIIATARGLRAAGFKVERALVLLDREEGAREAVAKEGIGLHAVFGARAMFEYAKDAEYPGRERTGYRVRVLSKEDYESVIRHFRAHDSKPT